MQTPLQLLLILQQLLRVSRLDYPLPVHDGDEIKVKNVLEAVQELEDWPVAKLVAH